MNGGGADGPAEAARDVDRDVRGLALAFGFDLVGVAPATPSPRAAALRDWVARGFGGSMAYIARRVEERADPSRVLPGARSWVVVGLVYDPGERVGSDLEVARYAAGDDYHEVMGERVRALATAIEGMAPPGERVRTRAYVDTGPVLERDAAARGGLGWIGKNTCLIHRGLGSYLFLGVVLTDLALQPDAPVPDHCGSCTACLDACPTDAFVEPYVLDATRCIAYTTIEDPGPIPEALRSGHGARLFGCDLCQEVCPWNQPHKRELPDDPLGLRARLAPRPAWKRAALAWVLGLDEDAWRAATRHSPLRRARYRGLVRNALVAAGNSGDVALRELVQRFAEGSDALLAEHARWALARLS